MRISIFLFLSFLLGNIKAQVNNPYMSNEILQEILQKGGSEEPADLFINFRGREPSIDALLDQCGLGEVR